MLAGQRGMALHCLKRNKLYTNKVNVQHSEKVRTLYSKALISYAMFYNSLPIAFH